MRQGGDLGGQAARGQYARNVVGPRASADQPCPEAVRLTQLEPDALQGPPEALRRRLFGKHLADALRIGARLRILVGEPLQRVAITRPQLLDERPAVRGRRSGRVFNNVVDDVEVAVVVQQATRGGELGVDAQPELHIPFEFRRPGNLRFTQGCQGQPTRQKHQAKGDRPRGPTSPRAPASDQWTISRTSNRRN